MGLRNADVKCCTPGVTAEIVSLHEVTCRAACRALRAHNSQGRVG